MYNSADISDRIKQAAKSKGVSMKKVLEDVHLGTNMMANMKTSVPKADNLAKIADYLGCSVDYLLGREPANSGAGTVEGVQESSLSPDEQQLLSRYRQLNQQGKEYILQTIDMACSVYTKNNEISSVENAG